MAVIVAVPSLGAGLYHRLARDDRDAEISAPDANSAAAGRYGGGI